MFRWVWRCKAFRSNVLKHTVLLKDSALVWMSLKLLQGQSPLLKVCTFEKYSLSKILEGPNICNQHSLILPLMNLPWNSIFYIFCFSVSYIFFYRIKVVTFIIFFSVILLALFSGLTQEINLVPWLSDYLKSCTRRLTRNLNLQFKQEALRFTNL